MWTEEYKNFRKFAENFRELFLFNTLRENGSLTCYDLQKYGNINPSKTYRKMKKLEEEGLLTSQSEQSKTGRPKINYYITDKGEIRRKEIRFEAERYFKFLKKNQILEDDFDISTFLEKTFSLWTEPVERIITLDISISAKIKALTDLEYDLMRLLDKVREEKLKLENEETIQED